jgi:hypothetical protein
MCTVTLELSDELVPLNETLGKIGELCKDSTLTVDRFLEMQHKDKELEDKLDPWTTRLMPARGTSLQAAR